MYPVFTTVATRSATCTPTGYETFAFSVAKLTVAVTPSMRLSFFSTRAAQEAQVIPPMVSSTSDGAAVAVAGVVWAVSAMAGSGAAVVMVGLQGMSRAVRSQYQLVGTARCGELREVLGGAGRTGGTGDGRDTGNWKARGSDC